uniref:DUF725 domain-containing protein n=1 Tax=Strongyloides venezuelensis TaxID=75913 RepID=A0A0K0F1W4_STRVS
MALIRGAVETPCSSNIQKCGYEIQDLERQIIEIKTKAFKKCIKKLNCLQERAIFEDCYGKSIKAVRSIYTGDNNIDEYFTDVSDKYRYQMEQCFVSNPILDLLRPHSQGDEFVNDEDAIYARAVFSTEFGDRLWGLDDNVYSRLSMEAYSSCLIKEFPVRVFGGGINRIIDTSNPLINNASTSCLLTTSEVTCYKNTLSHDGFYQQLVHNREATLRACIRTIRLQTQCKSSDTSRMRACMCNAREEFENRLQNNLLECVRKTDMTTLYKVLNEKQLGFSTNTQRSHDRSYSSYPQRGMEPVSSDSLSYSPPISNTQRIVPGTVITQGLLLNGQCLCACAAPSRHQQHTTYAESSFPEPNNIFSRGRSNNDPWSSTSQYSRIFRN